MNLLCPSCQKMLQVSEQDVYRVISASGIHPEAVRWREALRTPKPEAQGVRHVSSLLVTKW